MSYVTVVFATYVNDLLFNPFFYVIVLMIDAWLQCVNLFIPLWGYLCNNGLQRVSVINRT